MEFTGVWIALRRFPLTEHLCVSEPVPTPPFIIWKQEMKMYCRAGRLRIRLESSIQIKHCVKLQSPFFSVTLWSFDQTQPQKVADGQMIFWANPVKRLDCTLLNNKCKWQHTVNTAVSKVYHVCNRCAEKWGPEWTWRNREAVNVVAMLAQRITIGLFSLSTILVQPEISQQSADGLQ